MGVARPAAARGTFGPTRELLSGLVPRIPSAAAPDGDESDRLGWLKVNGTPFRGFHPN